MVLIQIRTRWLSWIWAALTLAGGASAFGETVPELDEVMFEDPRLEMPGSIRAFADGYTEFWIGVLDAPEAELRERAAHTLAWAHRNGLPNALGAVEPLIKNLDDENDRVRLSAARCLSVLDAQQAAARLCKLVDHDGLEAAQLVEPALACWDYLPRRATWRNWLQSRADDRPWLLLAIRCLGQVRDSHSAGALAEYLLDAGRSVIVRLEAADALGTIRDSGLEATAASLMQDPSAAAMLDRLAAAKLLRHHDSARARELMLELAQDPAPSVATIALQRLYDIDPALILPLTDRVLGNRDVNVRRIMAQGLIARPTPERIVKLARLLDDVNPSLRTFVRESLGALADNGELRPTVIAQAEYWLNQESWRGLEQAMRLLVQLDHPSQMDRFVELLDHPRTEVFVTASWGLCRLNVSQTLEPALQFATQRFEEMKQSLAATHSYRDGYDQQLSHLFQHFGRQKYAAAEPLMRKFIPKTIDYYWSRGGAIWALGYLYEDNANENLVKQFASRLADVNGLDPEEELVRRFAAISLGRMRAESAVRPLREFKGRELNATLVGYACAWSLQRITGEPFETAPPGVQYHTNFFLEPLREK